MSGTARRTRRCVQTFSVQGTEHRASRTRSHRNSMREQSYLTGRREKPLLCLERTKLAVVCRRRPLLCGFRVRLESEHASQPHERAQTVSSRHKIAVTARLTKIVQYRLLVSRKLNPTVGCSGRTVTAMLRISINARGDKGGAPVGHTVGTLL